MLGNSFLVLLVVAIAGILSRYLWVKTDLNWLFGASALPKLSEMGDPLTVIVEIVSVSFLLALMYFQNCHLFPSKEVSNSLFQAAK